MLVLGCRVNDVDAPQAAAQVLAFARGSDAAQIVTLGTEMVVYAQHDARFRSIVNASALSLCDTIGLLWAARARGAHLHDRVAGVDLIERLCDGASHEALGVYFLGGAAGVAGDAAARLCERHPGLIVAGTHHGYFDDGQSAQIAGDVRASGARLLLCGLGFPRQEVWLAEHLRETGCGAGIGIGGSFDVLAGRVQRAPRAWRRIGAEWLYRLVNEPHRWRRQLALPAFVGLLALDALGLRRGKERDS